MAEPRRNKEERAKLIELALEFAHDLGFTLPERAKLVGYDEEVGDNPEYLHRELTVLGEGKDVELRCELLLTLDALLEKIGRGNPASKREYIEKERCDALNGDTFKEWLTGGDLVRLEHAVKQLTYMSC